MKSDAALSMAYAQYAALEQVNGNYPGALLYQLQSLRITERTNDLFSISEAYFGLGDLYREAGDFAKAMCNLRKAISILDLNVKSAIELEKNELIVSRYIYCLVLFAQTFERFNQLDSSLIYANSVRDYLNGTGKWKTPGNSPFISRILT